MFFGGGRQPRAVQPQATREPRGRLPAPAEAPDRGLTSSPSERTAHGRHRRTGSDHHRRRARASAPRSAGCSPRRAPRWSSTTWAAHPDGTRRRRGPGQAGRRGDRRRGRRGRRRRRRHRQRRDRRAAGAHGGQAVRQARHRRQRGRHPPRPDDLQPARAGLGRGHPGPPEGALLHRPAGLGVLARAAQPAGPLPGHQLHLGLRAGRLARPAELRGGQDGHRRPHLLPGPGPGPVRRDRQRDRARRGHPAHRHRPRGQAGGARGPAAVGGGPASARPTTSRRWRCSWPASSRTG